jgi:hypothetical protein
VVLYELVAPPGTKPKKSDKSSLRFIHKMVGFVLELDSQMQAMDYDRPHFVHADLSFEAMMDEAKKKGDNGMTLALSFVADMMRKQNLIAAREPNRKEEKFDLEEILANPNVAKRRMARDLAGDTDLGSTMTTLLVDYRNKKALEEMTKQMGMGKKKIAIFYGAAHNPDFHKRLTTDHGMAWMGQEWFTAWDMSNDNFPDPFFRSFRFFMEK